MSNPKCLAAIQALQEDPAKALATYRSDPVVSVFLQEFGKMMAGHFEGLAEQQQGEKGDGKVMEAVGPLQAKAMANR